MPRESPRNSNQKAPMISGVIGFITRQLVRPYQPKQPPKKRVAVVVPLSNRPELSQDEKISLRHLCHFLGKYDKFLIVPPELEMQVDGFELARFSGKFFGSVAAHNRLLGSPEFYKRFSDYQYLFFYHLDSLAFSDQLSDWCEAGWDFIGPPFIHCEQTPWVKEPRVGNGGFALLKVESALKVLYNRYRQRPHCYWFDLYTRNGVFLLPWIRFLERLQNCFPASKLIQRILDEWQQSEDPITYNRNNDTFWSTKACQFLPQFKVAPVEEGLRFAFEAAPRQCLEMNQGRLPFGCHAWGRYDREFWTPHLLASEQ